jgi:hypothetical protein
MSIQSEIDRAYTTAVVLVASLIMGQLIFAGVAWYLASTGGRITEPVPITHPLGLAWLMLAAGSVFGAQFFRRQIPGPHDRPDQLQRIREGTVTPATLQTRIITMWALLEGAGLFGLVVYFLYGLPVVLYAALTYIAVTGLFFFPRREWFEALRQETR